MDLEENIGREWTQSLCSEQGAVVGCSEQNNEMSFYVP
jgi:hypothetical protein